ncbi:hypothetical protein DICPUDRAFT_74679 [Dictyostelium purpureum]|uniref:Uncharacterized protein n=1 Tax=Dictyostelium purpureum TaxID=5786 RepID=F0Z8F3_DICPU|nr:uncharacterized protein DICPUDRAFT_74679 [Dictyostelium purpureum]EGC39752.1 hypothetical protein DICPUDRAFT_74679 [Dictyostelium purpureum]|eukprot:XP_003283738.1 hypothetical protein DICPUDRAFT_74679 [Dictyostelium purpureum]
MIDNRKRKNPEPEIRQFEYPDYSNDVIADSVYKDIKNRNNISLIFRNEFKNARDEDILYDIEQFEIYYSTNKKSYTNIKPSPDRYVYIDQINSEKHFFIQGIIKSPPNSKYINQLIVAEISEYSLQYGDKSEWSLWIRVIGDEWFKLLQPYAPYSKYFSPMYYRFKTVMYTTQLFEKEKKNINYKKLENYLEKNYKDYHKDDILYFKDEVFKHVKEFLKINPTYTLALDKEMNEKIQEIESNKNNINDENNTILLKNVTTMKFTPPTPYNQPDKYQNDLNKEIKKLKSDMKQYFSRRTLTENDLNDLNEMEEYEMEQKERIEEKEIIENLNFETRDLMIFSLVDKNTLKKNYIGDRKIPGTKLGYFYNYDYDFNYDDDTYFKEFVPEKTRDREENESIEEKEKYLIQTDSLQFSKLPKETITFKNYQSLYLDDKSIGVERFNFDLEKNPNEDLLPFLVCRVCGVAKHITGANCDPLQKLDSDMSNSIQDFILHLERHRSDFLRSMSKKQRDNIDRCMNFNCHLNRSRIETIESNSLKELYSETSLNTTKPRTRSNPIFSFNPWP